MTVTMQSIKEAFTELESGTRSREEIAAFANQAMMFDDADSLRIEPPSEASKIWKAILYLSGVDIKESPEMYLHCVEDFMEFRASISLKLDDDGRR